MGAFTGDAGRRPWSPLAVAVVCVAQFVVVLDATIVTTALPAIRSALGFSPVGLAWVLTAYTLVFGGLLVPGGRVADLLGPRRIFGLGLAVFAVASAGCGLAWSPAVLIAARGVQGLGAALLSPAALALLTAVSEPGAARRRAVGWWTAAAAGGGASGWVLGGLFTQYLGWRAVFWVNLPIAVAVLALALRALPTGVRRADSRPDLVGGVTVTAALGLLVYGLSNIGERGARSPAGWLSLLLAGCLAAVAAWHLRRTPDPLLPRGLLRSRVMAGADLTALMLTAATTPAMYLSTLYVQQVLRFSPARASLLFPVFSLAVVAGSLAGPGTVRVVGARPTLLGGFAAIAGAIALLATLPGDPPAGGPPTTVARILGAFAAMGFGLGAASVASTHAGTEAAPPAHQGVSSGVLNSAAQVGTALGLAVVAPLAAAAGTEAVGGYLTGFAGAGVIALLGLPPSLLIQRVPTGSTRRAR